MFRRKTIIVLIAVFFSLFFTACWDGYHSSEPIYGSGRIVSERRTLPECSAIVIRSACDVYLTQGNEQTIVVEADDNIIDEVITKKEDGNLVVGLDDGSYSRIKVKVFVTLKSIRKLVIDGAGNISVSRSINADNLETAINGAGNITLKGGGNYLGCIVNGAGNIQADEFISNKVDAVVNGAGNCTVNVTNELIASVNGVGSIYYYGNPSNIKTFIGGVGRVIKK